MLFQDPRSDLRLDSVGRRSRLRHRRMYSIAIALFVGAIFSWYHVEKWTQALDRFTFAEFTATDRGGVYLYTTIASHYAQRFPSRSSEVIWSLEALGKSNHLRVMDFDLRMVPAPVQNEHWWKYQPISDDMGLFLIGHLFTEFLHVTRIIRAYVLSMAGLMGFCLALFMGWCLWRGRVWVALAVVVVYFYYYSRAFSDFAFLPYHYGPLVPLLLYVIIDFLKESAEAWPTYTRPEALFRVLGLASLMALVSLLVMVRGSAGVFVMVAIGMALFAPFFMRQADRSRAYPRALLEVCALSAVLLIAWLVPIGSSSRAFRADFNSSHSFWHMIWCSLGEYPNPHGLAFLDTAADRRARQIRNSMDGGGSRLEFASREYDQILRSEVLRIVRENPGFVLSVHWRKAQHRLGPFLFAIAVLFFLWFIRRHIMLPSQISPRSGGWTWVEEQYTLFPTLILGLLANKAVVMVFGANLSRFYIPTEIGESLAPLAVLPGVAWFILRGWIGQIKVSSFASVRRPRRAVREVVNSDVA